MVKTENKKVLLQDGQVLQFGDIKVEAILCPGHTGWTRDLDFAFRHRTQLCNPFKKVAVDDPAAPYDGYIEDDDTEEKARSVRLAPQIDWTPGR